MAKKRETKNQIWRVALTWDERTRLHQLLSLARPPEGRSGLKRMNRAFLAIEAGADFTIPPGCSEAAGDKINKTLNAQIEKNEEEWLRMTSENVEAILETVDTVLKDKQITGPVVRMANLRYVTDALDRLDSASNGKEIEDEVEQDEPDEPDEPEKAVKAVEDPGKNGKDAASA